MVTVLGAVFITSFCMGFFLAEGYATEPVTLNEDPRPLAEVPPAGICLIGGTKLVILA